MDRYRGFDVSLLCGAGGAEISGVDAFRSIRVTLKKLLRKLTD